MLTEKLALVFSFLLLCQAFFVDGRHTDSGSDEEDDERHRHKEKFRRCRKPSRWSSEEDVSGRKRSSRGSKRKDDDSWGPREDSWEDRREDRRGLFDIALKVLDSFLVSSQNRLKQAREKEEKQKVKMAQDAARRATVQAASMLKSGLKKPKKNTLLLADLLGTEGTASLVASPKDRNSEDHLLAAIKKAASKAESSKEYIKGTGRSDGSGNSSKSASGEVNKSDSDDESEADVKDKDTKAGGKKAENKKNKEQKRKRKGNSEEDKRSGGGKKKESAKDKARSKSGEEVCDCHSRESVLRNVGHRSSELAFDALERVSSRLGSAMTNLINAPRRRGSRESGEKE